MKEVSRYKRYARCEQSERDPRRAAPAPACFCGQKNRGNDAAAAGYMIGAWGILRRLDPAWLGLDSGM